ncbi:MAG: hydroxymethylbilane synthase, partial [Candidatus Hydrogenedentes bacterium]|nr:hydroxymethylbilane synthase [Candidatus Hydrogenedentota bacterium]
MTPAYAARLGELDVEVQQVLISTKGDRVLDVPLAEVGGKGLFTKELEAALLEGRADLAVHSLKDMPTRIPPGLSLAAVMERADPRDVLADRWGLPLEELPAGARIGTSSPRRVALLRTLRRDIQVVPIRGNVETRLRKAQGEECDGVVLAAAGLARLEREGEIAQYLPPETFVPAVGQGALAVEVRTS